MARYQRAADAAAQTTYHRVPVQTSAATLGRLAKGGLRRVAGPVGWYFVLKDLVDGAGWVIDELGQQVMDGPARDQDTAPAGTRMWCSTGGHGCALTPQSYLSSGLCTAQVRYTYPNNAGLSCTSILSCSGDPLRCNFQLSDGGSHAKSTTLVSTQTPVYGTGHVPQPVTDQQLGDLVKGSPEVVNAVLTDPQTGAPIQYPELVDAMNNLRKELEQQRGAEPGPDIVPNPDYENQPQPSETDWPGFCDWATKVCELVDWVMEPEEPETEKPEVPWEESEVQPSTWTSGLGGGACPAPIGFSIAIGGQTANPEFDMEGICSFGSMIRPLVIAIATVVAAYILGGIRSSKDA